MRTSLLKNPVFPFWTWLTWGRALYTAAWIVFACTCIGRLIHCVTEYDLEDTDPEARPPTPLFELPNGRKVELQGNKGSIQIDFGGQWLLGRMVVRGHGRDLYDRNRLLQVATEGFRLEYEPEKYQRYRFPAARRPTNFTVHPDYTKPDAVQLIDWMPGSENDPKRRDVFGEAVAIGLSGGIAGTPLGAAAEVVACNDCMTPDLAANVTKKSVGGPLYPPVHALMYAPLACIPDPRIAYFVFQILSAVAGLVAAYAISAMTRGRLWTPVVGTLIVLYPGYQPGLTLGQNHIVSLAVVCVGWALVCRKYEWLGGIVLGFLAFKPVWGLVFALVPLMMLRWRVVIGMGACGLGLAALTLPIVGIESWQDWLKNGGQATEVYNRNHNWIHLSRDLSGVVRRVMIDFNLPEPDRNKPTLFTRRLPATSPDQEANPKVVGLSEADLWSWVLLFAVFLTTLGLYSAFGRPRKPLGLSAGFLFLGVYLCCFRFMYYDALLSSLGVAVLFAYPWWFFRRTDWEAPIGSDALARRATFAFNSLPLTLLTMLALLQTYFYHLQAESTWKAILLVTKVHTLETGVNYNFATDTLLIIALWAWCGWAMIRSRTRPEDGDFLTMIS